MKPVSLASAELLPEGWSLLPLHSVARPRKRPNTGMRESNLLSLSYGQIIPKDINNLDGLLPESFDTYQIVEPGNIVCRFTDLQNDQRSLRTGLVQERGIITSAYTTIQPTIDSRWMHYFLRAYDQNKLFYGLGGGLRQGLKFDDIKHLPVVVPPREQQGEIAEFLDRETAQIDAMIDAQQRLIALLFERRLSAINTLLAAAHGIPRTPLGEVVEIQTGITLGKSYEGDTGLEEYPYLRVANVQTGHVNTDELTTILLPPREARRALLRAGDVLITEGGDRAALARGSLWRGQVDPCLHQNHIYALRPRGDRLVAEYLVYVLESSRARTYFERTRRQTTNLSATNSSLVRAFRFTLPSIDGQRLLVERLDETVARMDALIAAAERSIALLRERRAAVITAAVTGRLDPSTGVERVEEMLEGAAL